jgi:hypothetical protein
VTVTCPIRQALRLIAPHLETLAPVDREMLRPAVRAVESNADVIHVPERVVSRIRDIAARMPKQHYPYLPCPICKGVEGCDHTVPERQRAATL